jgi:amino acid adenylation domain-containing protein
VDTQAAGIGRLAPAQRDRYTARLRAARRVGQGAGDGAGAAGPIGRRDGAATRLPLSFAQEQLWFLDRFAPGTATYNIPFALRLTGPLDPQALAAALEALVARHESLRTRFVADADSRPVQLIDPPGAVALPIEDLAGLAAAERDGAWQAIAARDAVLAFDLAAGPLLRTRLVRFGPEDCVLVVVVHHIVFDGWSQAVFLREFAALYEAFAAGLPEPLPPLGVQFADYAIWERKRAADAEAEALAGHWRATLEGSPTLEMPTDRAHPVVQDFSGAVEWTRMGEDLSRRLPEAARNEGTTVFTVLLAGLVAVLHRYTGQDDLVVGTPSANRGRDELGKLIGFLVNTLPIRCDAAGDPAFRELVTRVRAAAVDAYAHQDLPFGRLVEEVRAERDPGRTPLFQITVTYAEALAACTAGAVTVEPVRVNLPAAKYDLSFLFEQRPDGLWLETTYATALFDADTVRRLARHLGILLDVAVRDPSLRLSQLPLLTAAELRRETVEWNDTAVALPSLCLHEMFTAQAARAPEAVAAESGTDSITYISLDRQSDQVARWLRDAGIGPDVLVGVSMAPSIRRLAVLLGIMKAGGGYVPLDPSLPADRLAYLATDTAMPVAVVDAAAAAVLDAATMQARGVRLLPVDEEWGLITGLEADDPRGKEPGRGAGPTDTAYVIYTSGSTGLPKAVVVEHRNAVNFVSAILRLRPLSPADRCLQVASLSFDASVLETFPALSSGASLVLASREVASSPTRLGELMRSRRITSAFLTPAVLGLLSAQAFPDLELMLTGAETLSADLARAWLRPGLRLVNLYGPTETTVVVTGADQDGSVPPPIGLPLANMQAYVLDAAMNPVPTGVVGELYVGGAGVARGYLNAPEQTREKFIPDPFRPGPGARLYKTGDRVRRRSDGQILFSGRADGQVKIRGLRIELGEVEAVLCGHPEVDQAVAAIAPDRSGEPQLVAYLRGAPARPQDRDGEGDPSWDRDRDRDLRAWLAERLPGYMVPVRLVPVAEFPLTRSGKVDRGRLPDAFAADRADADTAGEPETLLEAELARIIGAVLGRERVGVEEDFFALGGNSLQVMRLIAKIEHELPVAAELEIAAVFLAPTPRRLAAHLRSHGAADAPAAVTAGTVAPAATATSRLVRLGGDPADRSRPALFLVHAVEGTVAPYAPLAALLADAYTVYGIEAAGLQTGSTPISSLPAMVEHYLGLVRSAQPDGPYRLGGWSMGAVVAHELARRLEQEGEEVVFLALLDAPYRVPQSESGPEQGAEARAVARFAADVARSMGWTPPGSEIGDSAAAGSTAQDPDPLGRLAARFDEEIGGGRLEAMRAEMERRYRVFRAHTEALSGYNPSGPVRVAPLLVAADRSPNAKFIPDWSALCAGRAMTVIVEGDHYSFLRSPDVTALAPYLLPVALSEH